MSPIRRVWEYFRPPPIATAAAFRTFIEERAFLIAQKCAIDYCRGKTGLASYALFDEKPFLDALDACQRETFAAVLGDLLLIAEGQLRAQLTPQQRARLSDALAALYADRLAALPAPANRAQTGWNDATAVFAMRLKAAAAARPQQALDVADHSARRLFDTLPIHSSYRELDEEVVYGAVRFRMIAVSAEMQRRFAAAELARELAG